MKEKIICASVLLNGAAWSMHDDYEELFLGKRYHDVQAKKAVEEFKEGELAIKRKIIEDALATEGYAALITEIKDHHITPLNYAIGDDRCNDLLKKCLERDVPLLPENPGEKTLLYLAITYKAIENLKTLIFYMQKKYGQSYSNILNYPIKIHDGGTILHQAVGKNNVEAVRMLLNFPLNVNQQDDRGNTPLHAIDLECDFKKNKKKAKQIIKLLMAAGANPEIRNCVQSPFTFADYEPQFQYFNPIEYIKDMGKTISQLRSTAHDSADHIMKMHNKVAGVIEKLKIIPFFRQQKMDQQSFISVLPREIIDEGCKFIAEAFA